VSFLGSPGFLLELRSIFFVLSTLTGLAVDLPSLRLTCETALPTRQKAASLTAGR